VRVGVDIGTAVLKLVGVDDDGEVMTLQRLAVEPLPRPIDLRSPQDEEAQELLADCLGAMVVTCGLGDAEAVVSLPALQDDTQKRITLPEMTVEELAEQIRWEAEQHVLISFDAAVLGFDVAARRPDQGQMDVALVAVEKGRAGRYLDATRMSGLRPSRCVLDTTALWAWYRRTAPDATRPTAIIDLGAAKTSVSTCEADGVLSHWRAGEAGGEAVTTRLCQELSLSRQEAEQRKQAICAPAQPMADYRAGYRAPSPGDDVRVERIVEAATKEMARELGHVVDFLDQVQTPVERIWLTGGSQHLPRVGRYLRQHAPVSVERCPLLPSAGLEAGPGVDSAKLRQWSGQLAVALGTCCDPRPGLRVPGLVERQGIVAWVKSLFW